MWGESVSKLFAAIDLLTRPNGVSRKELAEALEVDGRTVYRILERVEAFGLPLLDQREPGERQKRWRLDKSCLLSRQASPVPILGMSTREVMSLLMARLSLGPLVGTQLEQATLDAIRRVANLAPQKLDAEEVKRLFPVMPSLAKNLCGKEDILFTLVSAATNRRSCKAAYNSFHRGRVVEFEFGVISLFSRNNGLYAFIKSVDHDDVRVIAVERIQTLELGSRAFTPPQDFDPERALANMFVATLDDPIHCVIRISSDQARYVVERDFPAAHMKDQPDGSVLLTLSTSGRNDVKRWVLSFGAQAVVIEPTDLAKEVSEELVAALNNYPSQSAK